eukprot:10354978-Alexandrium_andersonii.AAC.1
MVEAGATVAPPGVEQVYIGDDAEDHPAVVETAPAAALPPPGPPEAPRAEPVEERPPVAPAQATPGPTLEDIRR